MAQTALIIDDNEIDIMIAAKNLEMSGLFANILIAKNGQEAIDLIQASVNESFPDHIFLDINMPVLDGWGFLDLFDEIGNIPGEKPKVFMLSSSIDEADTDRANKNPNVTSFISKPLNASKVNQILAQVA
ncbi:MAG: response regulator [Flavobacteriales bacterium]|nr:response regulator [Flavobacteriales bacterium]